MKKKYSEEGMGGDNKVWLLEKEKCDNTGNSTLGNIYIIYNLQSTKSLSPPPEWYLMNTMKGIQFNEYNLINTM